MSSDDSLLTGAASQFSGFVFSCMAFASQREYVYVMWWQTAYTHVSARRFYVSPLTFDRVCRLICSRSKWLFLSSGNSIYIYEIRLLNFAKAINYYFPFVHSRRFWTIRQQVFSHVFLSRELFNQHFTLTSNWMRRLRMSNSFSADLRVFFCFLLLTCVRYEIN